MSVQLSLLPFEMIHIAQMGETLSSIAKIYGTTYQKIADRNEIASPYTIYANQGIVVSIPYNDKGRKVKKLTIVILSTISILSAETALEDIHREKCDPNLNSFNRTIYTSGSAHTMDLTTDGKLIAIDSGSYITLIGVKNAKLIKKINVDSAISEIKFSPNDKTIAFIVHDKTIKLMDVQSGKIVKMLKGYKNFYTIFTHDSKTLVTICLDKTIRFWDIKSGQISKIFKGNFDFLRMVLNHDSTLLAVSFLILMV